MIGWLLLILPVAVLFYAVLPALFNFFYKKLLAARIDFLRREGLMSGVYARVSGFYSRKLMLEAFPSGSLIPVVPSATVFLLSDGKYPKKIPWRFFLSIPRGLHAFYIPPAGFKSPAEMKAAGKNKIPGTPKIVRRRGMCVFFTPPDDSGDNGGMCLPEFSVPEKTECPLKPFFVATGAFLEFVLFLFFMQGGQNFAAAITALAAVFGRVVPYCPPGLFFTLASAYLLSRNPSAKFPALVIKSLGVVVNVIAFLLAIRSFSVQS